MLVWGMSGVIHKWGSADVRRVPLADEGKMG